MIYQISVCKGYHPEGEVIWKISPPNPRGRRGPKGPSAPRVRGRYFSYHRSPSGDIRLIARQPKISKGFAIFSIQAKILQKKKKETERKQKKKFILKAKLRLIFNCFIFFWFHYIHKRKYLLVLLQISQMRLYKSPIFLSLFVGVIFSIACCTIQKVFNEYSQNTF